MRIKYKSRTHGSLWPRVFDIRLKFKAGGWSVSVVDHHLAPMTRTVYLGGSRAYPGDQDIKLDMRSIMNIDECEPRIVYITR